MDWIPRVRAAFQGTTLPDADIIDELAEHARTVYEAARAEGVTHDDATARVDEHLARWRVDAEALRRTPRRPAAVLPPSSGSASVLRGVWQDLRYGARLIRRQPRPSLLVIATMAIGMACATVLVSVSYAVLVRPLPWPHADRLVELHETRGGRNPRFGAFTNAALLAWRDQAGTVEGIAAWSTKTVTLESPADPERVRVTTASADLFGVLGVTAEVGSLFTPRDETEAVIILSESLWRRRFNGDRATIGGPVYIDGRLHTVIGVVDDAFSFPDRQYQAWLPMRVGSTAGNSLSTFYALGLLRPGATPAQAAEEGTARGRFAADTGMTTTAIFGSSGPIEIAAVRLRDALTADVRPALVLLLAAAGLLLLTATANVASLQLARATTRRRELAVRAAIGAGAGRLARQLLIENLLLALAGGISGVLLAWWIHQSLPVLLPTGFPRASDVALDPLVVTVALGLSMLSGVAFGVLPAIRMRRLNLVAPLTEGGTAPAGAGPRSRTGRLRLLILTGQIATTCLLLVGASLLGRSFWTLVHADRGYDPTNVLAITLPMPATKYTAERRYELIEQLLERLSARSDITSVSFTSELPLRVGGSTAGFSLQAPMLAGPVQVQASPRLVSPGYFQTMRMRLVAGRSLADTDTQDAEPVAVVNRRFVERYLGDTPPLSIRIPMGIGYQTSDSSAAIVGVVDDVRYATANDVSQPEIYYSYRQLGHRVVTPVATLLVRAAGDARALTAPVRAIVRAADPGLVADPVSTMDDRLSVIVASPRLYAVLLGVFASFALIVSAVGLFGVLSYSVGQRSRELAVRAALGAGRWELVQLVLRQGMAVTAAGAVIGIGASLIVAPSIRALLYGVTSFDRPTFIIVPLLVMVVALIACVGPALRAGRVDPVRELKGG